MSVNSQNNDNQEIDLAEVSKKIGGFFNGISNSFFKLLFFIKSKAKIIIPLFILGVVLGFLLDKTSKSYENQVIVTPNFGSTDYLYDKINLIDAKIKENDTLFLKNVVGITKPKKFNEISIEPITDVYKFIDNNEGNFELIKLMAEDGDIKKIVTDNITSKNYPYHKISFATSKEFNENEVLKPLLNFLNNSDYFKKVQKEYVNNVTLKIKENDSTLTQINSFLNTFSSTVNGSQKSDKLVYYNENSQLDEVLKTKNELINEQGRRRLELINIDRIVKENSSVINIKNTKSVNGKMKFIFPILFVLLYLLANSFLVTYSKKQKQLQ